ncbi:MAG: hypothetical protein LQ342_007115 [Letrouitia transgressa]|nr:MAG: hypothetical protein LQ342_007115 [Letrouitia transgressa]
MVSRAPSLDALLERTSLEDHEEVLQACNAVLKHSKKDVTAQHVKAVALLKLDKYDDALRVLEEGGATLKNGAQLETAYALYKTGKLDEAKIVAQSITNDRGARHVEAQASYRSEEFLRAASLYKDLIASQAAIDNEENDLRINASATYAQLEWQKQGHLVERLAPRREDLEAFETTYNAACVSIAQVEFGRGEVLLKRAKDLCGALEDLSEEEKAKELLPIGIQQAYVLSKLGKIDEAQKLISSISLQEIPDRSTRLIAQNNRLATSTEIFNPYLAHREFASALGVPKSDKLFTYQDDRIRENQLILDLLMSKYRGVSKSTSRFLGLEPPATISPHPNKMSVLNAAARAQTQLGKLGLKQILPLLEKRPYDIGLVMTVVQLYVLTNNHGSATTVLETFLRRLNDSKNSDHEAIRYAPGLIAILISLYSLQGRRSHIQTELAKAATYWRHKSKPQRALLQAAGLALLGSSRKEDRTSAQQIFSALHAQDPDSRFATAGYVAAHSLSSPDLVSKEADSLTPVARLIAGVDITALEEAGVASITPNAEAAKSASRKRALEEKPKSAKKRVRRSKLPKDYDVNKAPDPERWLPLRERSTYRPKNRKGRQKAAALTQGGVEKAPEKTTGDNLVKASSGGQQGKGKKKKGKK